MPIENYGRVMGDAADFAMMPYNTLMQRRNEQNVLQQRDRAITDDEQQNAFIRQKYTDAQTQGQTQHDQEEAAWQQAYAAKDWAGMARVDPQTTKILWDHEQANKPVDPIQLQDLGATQVITQGGQFKGQVPRPAVPRVAAAPKTAATADVPGGELSDKGKAILSEMTIQGVQLPGGLRGEKMIRQTIGALEASNPDLSAAEITQAVKTGKIDITAATAHARTAGNIAGRVAVGLKEIDKFAPMVIEASATVPRGKFVPLNNLMQMGQSAISDPGLKVLRGRITAILNAYDTVAGRGGTDMEKRKHVREMIMSADSHEALVAAVKNLQLEAGIAEQAANDAVRPSQPNSTPPTAAATQPTKPPPIMQTRLSPAAAKALPSGTHFIGLDGVERVKH